ncbi:hypothetical protein E4K10_22070 [Streptomyces sp. T1317-0309]|nr:hypothetical protein E4K10_22070 [Streptomyces sp. T1317-0309]
MTGAAERGGHRQLLRRGLRRPRGQGRTGDGHESGRCPATWWCAGRGGPVPRQPVAGDCEGCADRCVPAGSDRGRLGACPWPPCSASGAAAALGGSRVPVHRGEGQAAADERDRGRDHGPPLALLPAGRWRRRAARRRGAGRLTSRGVDGAVLERRPVGDLFVVPHVGDVRVRELPPVAEPLPLWRPGRGRGGRRSEGAMSGA